MESNNKWGLHLSNAHNNTIEYNEAHDNNLHAFRFFASDRNVITNNDVTNHNSYGIWLEHADNNTIKENEASNVDYGINLDESDLNWIYDNNVTNNENATIK